MDIFSLFESLDENNIKVAKAILGENFESFINDNYDRLEKIFFVLAHDAKFVCGNTYNVKLVEIRENYFYVSIEESESVNYFQQTIRFRRQYNKMVEKVTFDKEEAEQNKRDFLHNYIKVRYL